MPQLSLEKKAVMDVLNFLHVNEVLTSFFISGDDKKTYDTISSLVNKTSLSRYINEIDILIYNHYLFCALEIALSENFFTYINDSQEDCDSLKVGKYEIECSLALLCTLAKNNGVNEDYFISDLMELLSDNFISNLNPAIKFKLASMLNSFNHPYESIRFYCHMNNHGVLKSKKYNSKEKPENNKELHLSFIRVGLMMEFEMLRNSAEFIYSPKNTKKLIISPPQKEATSGQRRIAANYYKKIIDSLFMDGTIFTCFMAKKTEPSYSNVFLHNVGLYFPHKRIFNGTMAAWPGIWGAFLTKSIHDKRPELPIYHEKRKHKKPESYKQHKNNTGKERDTNIICEKVKKELNKHGITVMERTIYMKYRTIFLDEYEKIKKYHQQIEELPCTLKWNYTDVIYNEICDISINEGELITPDKISGIFTQ